MSRKKTGNKIDTTLSSEPFDKEPQDSFYLVNKYGTYEIQPTADTDNSFPKIAQGLAKPENRKFATEEAKE